MIQLDFEGWFQCRLATDPDPTDEPRGVSGWTFALAGEPDLDRIIYTQPSGKTVQRRFGPTVGVRISTVHVDGQMQGGHPLLNAPIELLGAPVFEGRNGLASEDTEEPIFPFHIRISHSTVLIEREFRDIRTSDWRFERSQGTSVNRDALARAGIGTPEAYVQTRMDNLSNALKTEQDELEKVRLEARLKHIKQRRLGPVPLFVGLRYRYVLDGPWVTFKDPRKVLGLEIDSTPWIADLWVGCWDADLLCGYMIGSLICASRLVS